MNAAFKPSHLASLRVRDFCPERQAKPTRRAFDIRDKLTIFTGMFEFAKHGRSLQRGILIAGN